MTLVQPLSSTANQWITRATLTFDGRSPVTVALGPASRTAAGQTVTFPTRSFSRLRVTIDATNLVGASPTLIQNASSVGLAEVGLGGAQEQEVVSMPDDLLTAAGAASQLHRLAIVMTRERVAPIPPRSDLEPTLSREFSLPTARTFTLTGSATVNTLIPDGTIDTLVGRPGSSGSGIVAYSLGRLPGDLHDTASAAVDGNPSTMWSPGFGPQVGQWIQVHVPKRITFDHLDLQVVADGHHSVPTSITISTESGSDTVTLPPITDGRRQNSTVSVPLSFPALSGQQIQITFTGVRAEVTKNYYAHNEITLPLGITELGLPGVDEPAVPASMPGTCQSDLLSIDGRPVWLQVTGSTADALDGKTLTVQTCGPDAGGLSLGAGRHIVQSASGHVTGFDIDQLVLDSAPGGGPEPEVAGAPLPAPSPGPTATVSVLSQTATSFHLRVTGADSPFWLTLGESINKGWLAENLQRQEPRDRDAGRRVRQWLAGRPGRPRCRRPRGIFRRDPDLAPPAPGQHRSAPVGRRCPALPLPGPPAQSLAPPGPAPWRDGATGGRRRVSALPMAAAFDGGTLVSVQWRERRHGTGHGTIHPELASPISAARRRPAWWAVLLAPLLAGGIAAAVQTRPKVGLAVAVVVLATLLVRHLRFLLTLTAIGLVAATGVYSLEHQALYHFPAGGWPINFEPASELAWLAVVVLVADVFVDLARGGARSPGPASRRTWWSPVSWPLEPATEGALATESG